MARSTFLIAALLACVVAASAQTQWFVTENWRGGSANCNNRAVANLETFTATRAGSCRRLGSSFTKTDCASDGYTVSDCIDSACSNCTARAKVAFVTCTLSGSNLRTTRCGDLPVGGEGLSVISYADTECRESVQRTWAFGNSNCASSSFTSGNLTVSGSGRLNCGGDIQIENCAGNTQCQNCITTTYRSNTCLNGLKYVCGSDTAGASTVVLSILGVVAASVLALLAL